MAKFFVETVQNAYTTYLVEASGLAEAGEIVTRILRDGPKTQDDDDILNQSVPNGYGDFEEVISVEEEQNG
jgi:hypothetical protein